MSNFSTDFLKIKFGDIDTYTFTMPVKDVLSIQYVAVRGVDKEEGSVQRVLNRRRIGMIRDYILDGNQFFNSFILNWTEKNNQPKISQRKISIPLTSSSAQVIDGQHRLAGYEQAVEEDPNIGEQKILVTLCLGLTTSEAATIFLNINTEQKPVPKSLIFDLFGEVENDEDHAINRATDIARNLNEDPESALYKMIKFPGSPRGVGSIELSTFVASIKEALKPGGAFRKYKLKSFDYQKNALMNFFNALRDPYEESEIWHVKSKNPFMKAAGFNGAMDYFLEKLIPECANRTSFSKKVISDIISLEPSGLLTWIDLKGNDGKTARKKVREFLESSLLERVPDQDEYDF